MTDHQRLRPSDAIYVELVRLRRIEEQAQTLLETSPEAAKREAAVAMLRRVVDLRSKLLGTN